MNSVSSRLPRLRESNSPATQDTSGQVGKFNRAGREEVFSQSCFLLGLPWAEFQGFTAVPWNKARLCGHLKEIPTALVALFHDGKLIQFSMEY